MEFERWQLAYQRLEMPLERFLLIYVGASIFSALLLSFLLMLLLPGFFIGWSAIVLAIGLPILAGIVAVFYPLFDLHSAQVKIEKEMHMFITRMGILSLGEVGAKSMFDILRQMADYGELAIEVKKIETLVEKWHTSLPEASRIVGRQSPSPLFADFLDRMAFSVESGQQLDEFMRAERETIAQEYDTLYDTRLESVDMLKEIYISLVTSGLFGLVVAGIHLVLFQTGSLNDDPWVVVARLRWVLLAGFLFVFIQVVCLFAFRAIIPDDAVFSRDELTTPYRTLFRNTWMFSGLVASGLLLFMLIVTLLYWDVVMGNWSRFGLLIIAFPLTPLMAPAFIQRREEKATRRRDESYPGFIRALGGTAAARAAEPSATMRALRGIDFGKLNPSIERLEKRLSTRIDSDRAWDFFTADTSSAMIGRFNRIYLEGAQSSGLPGEVAEVVSQTTTNLLGLRKRRSLSAGTMWGVAIGLLIATIASLDITISIVSGLGSSISDIALSGSGREGGVLSETTGGFGLPVLSNPSVMEQNISLFHITTSILVTIQVFIMSLIATRLRGSGLTSGVGQMVMLLWLAAIVSLLTQLVLEFSLDLFFQSGIS